METESARRSHIGSPRARSSLIYVLGLSNFSLGTGAFVFGGLMEDLARGLSVSVSASGQLQTLYVISAALLGPFLMASLGRHSPKRVLQVALLSAVVLNLGCVIAPNYHSMLVLRLLLGAIAAISGPLAIAVAASLVPADRHGSALAIWAASLASRSARARRTAAWAGT